MIIDQGGIERLKKQAYDICIIGGGVAGITLALDLESTARVAVIEAGGTSYSGDSQAFYRGENVGLRCRSLEHSRLRYLGGSSGHWGGMCSPLDPEDFQSHHWIAGSGWPIKQSSLAPYLEKAHEILELGEANYELSQWQSKTLRLGEDFKSKMWRYSTPVRFGKKYYKTLKDSKSIDVYLNGMWQGFSRDTNNDLASGVVRFHGGETALVESKILVLASGGIENARLLLLSEESLAGVGGFENVGRYFMEHPHFYDVASVALFGRNSRSDLYRILNRPKVPLNAHIQLTPEVRQRLRLSNSALVLQDLGGLGLADTRLVRRAQKISQSKNLMQTATVHLMSEQLPNRESRVRLSEQKDGYGLPRAALDWQLLSQDWRSIRGTLKQFAQSLGATGVGRCRLAPWLLGDSSLPRHLDWGHHHMGTTRMSANASSGVVDSDGRVFGLKNLFVAGSSVFPTGGCANPTLSIVCLALRLANRLKKELGASQSIAG